MSSLSSRVSPLWIRTLSKRFSILSLSNLNLHPIQVHTHTNLKKQLTANVLLSPLEDLKLMTQMSSRMNATQMIQSSSRTPIFNFDVLLLTSRCSLIICLQYSKIKSNRCSRDEWWYVSTSRTGLWWGSVTIPILLPFDCARQIRCGKKRIGIETQQIECDMCCLADRCVCIQNSELSSLRSVQDDSQRKEAGVVNGILSACRGYSDVPYRHLVVCISGITRYQRLDHEHVTPGVWISLVTFHTSPARTRKQFYKQKRVTFNKTASSSSSSILLLPQVHRRTSFTTPRATPLASSESSCLERDDRIFSQHHGTISIHITNQNLSKINTNPLFLNLSRFRTDLLSVKGLHLFNIF